MGRNENVQDDLKRQSTGQAPGSAPRQCPHYVDTTGTFLTGKVKPNEIKAFLTFEKIPGRKCPYTDSYWWIKYNTKNPHYKGTHSEKDG